MAFDFEIPMEDIPDAEAAEQLGGGKYLPPGKYHAIVTAVDEAEANSGSSGIELEYTALAGPHAGQVVTDTLWLTEKTRNRLVLFAKRLNLIPPDAYGKSLNANVFANAVGCQCVIEVEEESYTKKNGGTGKKSRIPFAGIYRLDDPDVKDVPRGNVPAGVPAANPAANGQPAMAGAGAKTDTWDDL